MHLPNYVTLQAVQVFVEQALIEDVGPGDYSTLSTIPADLEGSAYFLGKEDGIIAGITAAKMIGESIDPLLQFAFTLEDGQKVAKGKVFGTLKGKVHSILKAERLILNTMQRMSGIATKSYAIASELKGTDTKVLDTRKTTPNFRLFEKWAVYIGGGTNHRFGLYDLIMLKDNHVDFCGGVVKALQKSDDYRKSKGLDIEIEIETRNLEEVRLAVETGIPEIIMLDNMPPKEMTEAVQLINGRAKTEASGGITKADLKAVAATGVDFVSMGALTHSAQNLDISLKAGEPPLEN